MKNDLALRRMDDHITTSSTGRTAWYALGAQRWSFRTGAERRSLIASGASCYAGLVGRRIRLRVTSRPYPVEQWAQAVDQAFPDALPGWSDHLRAEQRHVLGLTLANKEVYLGVDLKVPKHRHHAAVEELRMIDTTVAGPGLDGRPTTPKEIEYLMHRSVCLGAPAPLTLPPDSPVWEAEDLAAFADSAQWMVRPFDRSVRIVADVNGRQYVRHVVVLTLGRMQDLDIPDRMEPWLQRSDRLFPVEWSVTADVVETAKVRHEVQDILARIKAQLDHYAEHDEIPPAALSRQQEHAIQVEDEISDPNPLNTRVHCWVRAAVSGATEQEAIDRAHILTETYLPQLPMLRGADQFKMAREFIPGEPLANSAHKRRMPVTTFAAALPAVTALIGDRSGFHIGSTAGSSMHAVCWHPWQSMEIRERSGTTVFGGSLGSGKSTLMGVIAYWSTLAGIPTVLLDPSGPLSRLTLVPELRDYSSSVDLMNAIPGALNPYAVISDPIPEHYLAERVDGMTDEEWQHESEVLYRRAVSATQAMRRTLCIDTLNSLLPVSLVRKHATHRALTDAARKVPGYRSASPRMVLHELAQGDDHAQYVGRTLEDLAEMPQVRLIFPEGQTPSVVRDDMILQVLTMRGNVLPAPGKPREEWTIAETMGIPLMTLAAYLTSRHVYSADMHSRKLVGIDEVHALTQISAGQSFLRSTARDTRKHNCRLMLSSQNTSETLVSGIENFLDGAFIGRTEGEDEQASALKTLGVPRGVGYENVLGGLSPRERQSETRTGFREFVWNDGDGGIEKIRIDVPPTLRAVLDTTADPTKAQRPTLTVIRKAVNEG